MALSTIPADQHITAMQQFRKCGKGCKTCMQMSGHGPYWYVYWRQGNRVRSTYVGKVLPECIEARLQRQRASLESVVSRQEVVEVPVLS